MSGADLKADARELIRKNLPRIFIISLFYLFSVTVLSELSYRLPGTVDVQNLYDSLSSGEMPSISLLFINFRPAGVVLALTMFVFRPLFDTGFNCYCLKVRRRQETAYNDFLYGFQLTIRIISIFIITSVFILLWSLLLIIPGIVAAYRYRLAYYILIDDPTKSALSCISESATMMNGYKVDLFIIDISFWGWGIADFIVAVLLPLPFALRVVFIWIAPYRGLTYAGFYEACKKNIAV